MELKEAMNVLRETLVQDEDYMMGWVANIAMAYQDEAARQGTRDSRAKLRDISNIAAENFMNALIRNAK